MSTLYIVQGSLADLIVGNFQLEGGYYGGPDASDAARRSLAHMPAYLSSLPYGIGEESWSLSQEPTVQHIEFEPSFHDLIKAARPKLEPYPGFLKVLFGYRTVASHLCNATMFSTATFEKPFSKSKRVYGSLAKLRSEIEELSSDILFRAYVRSLSQMQNICDAAMADAQPLMIVDVSTAAIMPTE